jgi:hypothetical protein
MMKVENKWDIMLLADWEEVVDKPADIVILQDETVLD